MPIVTTRSVVLQTYPYSDTSKILRLMTRDHGPRSAIAKGARRPKSRFGGLIEPFAEGYATLYLKENRDLHTLSDFDLIRDRQGLGVDLPRYAGGAVLCEMVMRLAPEHRDDRLFKVLVSGLDALVDAGADEAPAVALRQIWRVVAALGFAPDLRHCVSCGSEVGGDREVSFDYGAGGLRCPACGPEGARLSPGELAVLRALVHGGAQAGTPAGETAGGAASGPGGPPSGEPAGGGPAADRWARQRRVAVDFIRYHLAEGTRLRSLEFLGGAG